MPTPAGDTDAKLTEVLAYIHNWERAEPLSQYEHDVAEAFTRSFAELNEMLRSGARLPGAWSTLRQQLRRLYRRWEQQRYGKHSPETRAVIDQHIREVQQLLAGEETADV